jgi:hypothetical protein
MTFCSPDRRPVAKLAARVAVSAGALAALVAGALPLLDRVHAACAVARRLDDLGAGFAAVTPAMAAACVAGATAGVNATLAADSSPQADLASWQTIGGCGAGAAAGSGVGLKWIGRNVTGGLFHLETQGNYVETSYGHDYLAMTTIQRDLGEKWNLGVAVPYIYKFISNPYGLDVDLANKGPGDVNLMLTRRFGDINDTVAMLNVGLPTGTHEAMFRNTEVLKQETQLSLGKPTASLMIDHTIDNIWGPVVIGGTVGYRGGENELKSYRAPVGSLYSYAGYLMGPFVPAFGISATGWKDHDRDRGEEQFSPLFNVAAQVSIEYSTPWMALLIGGVLPYQYNGRTEDPNGKPISPWGLGSWLLGVGLALAPF